MNKKIILIIVFMIMLFSCKEEEVVYEYGSFIAVEKIEKNNFFSNDEYCLIYEHKGQIKSHFLLYSGDLAKFKYYKKDQRIKLLNGNPILH